MTTISKRLFYERMDKHVHCSNIHPWEMDCRKVCLSPFFISSMIKGSGKFFLPIYLLKLLINYKKINDPEFIKSILKDEARSVLYGTILSSTLFSSICLLRHVFGRLEYYNVLLVPGMLSGLSLLVESRENQVLDTLIFFNSFVEAVLRMVHLSYMEMTPARETVMFMVVSAALMYLLENRRKNLNMTIFWFYKPARVQTADDETNYICCHTDQCWKFWQEGFAKYFALGYLVNTIRKLLPRWARLLKKPQELVRVLFGKSNVKFGLFIGGYVAVYRSVSCYLVRSGKAKRKLHGLIAGFISGVTYAVSPNLQVLVAGITALLQMLYSELGEKVNTGNNFWPRQLLYMVCHGVLLHLKIFYPNVCPAYYKNMVDACSNNLVKNLYTNFISKYYPDKVPQYGIAGA